jgi:hypothetical protein
VQVVTRKAGPGPVEPVPGHEGTATATGSGAIGVNPGPTDPFTQVAGSTGVGPLTTVTALQDTWIQFGAEPVGSFAQVGAFAVWLFGPTGLLHTVVRLPTVVVPSVQDGTGPPPKIGLQSVWIQVGNPVLPGTQMPPSGASGFLTQWVTVNGLVAIVDGPIGHVVGSTTVGGIVTTGALQVVLMRLMSVDVVQGGDG